MWWLTLECDGARGNARKPDRQNKKPKIITQIRRRGILKGKQRMREKKKLAANNKVVRKVNCCNPLLYAFLKILQWIVWRFLCIILVIFFPWFCFLDSFSCSPSLSLCSADSVSASFPFSNWEKNSIEINATRNEFNLHIKSTTDTDHRHSPLAAITLGRFFLSVFITVMRHVFFFTFPTINTCILWFHFRVLFFPSSSRFFFLRSYCINCEFILFFPLWVFIRFIFLRFWSFPFPLDFRVYVESSQRWEWEWVCFWVFFFSVFFYRNYGCLHRVPLIIWI